MSSRPTSYGQEAVASPHTVSSPKRVVLVDDEPGIVTTWGMILRSAGYDVICSTEPRRALGLIAAGCDLVITDYHMPEMDGIELIRAARRRSHAQFVLMTANDTAQVAAAARTAGAHWVVVKPVSPSLVLHGVAKLLARNGHGR